MFEEFCEAFGVWDEARPYLGLMVDEEEMRLVLALGQESCTVAEVAGRLGLEPGAAAALLDGAYGRHIVDRIPERSGVDSIPERSGVDSIPERSGVDREMGEDQALFKASRFDRRLNQVAKHGRWTEVPEEARRALDHHFLGVFVEQHRPAVEAMMRAHQGGEPEPAIEGRRPPNDALLLLHEVEEMIDAAAHVALEPCDCRRLGEHCARPVDTCIWMDDMALEALERGHGRRLSREEAKEVVRRADKAGLMHTGDSMWQERGLGAICNCCACDCYPFRAAQILGSKGTWPRSRYLARYDPEACNLCGACVKRCHFGAFYHDSVPERSGADGKRVVAFASRGAGAEGRKKAPVSYDPALCWGCGLCANTCPSGAITIEALP